MNALEKREDEITNSLENAEKARKELERLTTEGDEIIAQARSEAQAIVSEGKKAADQLKESTLLKAKEEAVTNLEQAKEQIQVEKDKAIAEIKGEVVGLSLSIAEKLVKGMTIGKLKSPVHQGLDRGFIAETTASEYIWGP